MRINKGDRVEIIDFSNRIKNCDTIKRIAEVWAFEVWNETHESKRFLYKEAKNWLTNFLKEKFVKLRNIKQKNLVLPLHM